MISGQESKLIIGNIACRPRWIQVAVAKQPAQLSIYIKNAALTRSRPSSNCDPEATAKPIDRASQLLPKPLGAYSMDSDRSGKIGSSSISVPGVRGEEIRSIQ